MEYFPFVLHARSRFISKRFLKKGEFWDNFKCGLQKSSYLFFPSVFKGGGNRSFQWHKSYIFGQCLVMAAIYFKNRPDANSRHELQRECEWQSCARKLKKKIIDAKIGVNTKEKRGGTMNRERDKEEEIDSRP